MLNKKRLNSFRLIKFSPGEEALFARLPDVYKKFYNDVFKAQPKPVHYLTKPGRFEKNSATGIITPVQNVAIPTRFPKEMNQVLLGGEMVIRGFEKRSKDARRVPKFWVPTLKRSVVYSEILNKHFSAIVTDRLILLIHEHKGFDNYLLENNVCDLRTALALKMKKEILTALLNKNLPYDNERNCEIYEKYKQYIIPKEDLEWFGLTFWEACQKQQVIEESERLRTIPLKSSYRLQLIEELKRGPLEDDLDQKPETHTTGWLTKMTRPFARGK